MKPGLHDIQEADYHADNIAAVPSLSRSIAHLLCTTSPAHVWTAHPRLNPNYHPQEAEHFDIGSIAHDLLLNQDAEKRLVLVHKDDWRTKEAKEARAEARLAGNIPLLARHWDAVQAMVEAALKQLAAHDAVPPLFKDGMAEQTLVWTEGDVVCRARLDFLHDGPSAVDDYKTTSQSANPERWSRSLFGNGYDLQAAFYLRGLEAVTGATDVPFRFFVQETYPPYAGSVVSLGEDVLTLAREKVEYAINLWRKCVAENNWPAYPTKVCYADLPAYEEARWLERETREEIAA